MFLAVSSSSLISGGSSSQIWEFRQINDNFKWMEGWIERIFELDKKSSVYQWCLSLEILDIKIPRTNTSLVFTLYESMQFYDKQPIKLIAAFTQIVQQKNATKYKHMRGMTIYGTECRANYSALHICRQDMISQVILSKQNWWTLGLLNSKEQI